MKLKTVNAYRSAMVRMFEDSSGNCGFASVPSRELSLVTSTETRERGMVCKYINECY